MAFLYNFIVDATSSAMSALQLNNDATPGSENDSPPPTLPSDGPYVSHVLAVKRMLLLGPKLPLEIVDTIIDYAEYWPHTSVVTKKSFLATGAHVNRTQDNGDVFLIRSLPLGYVHDPTDTFALPISHGYCERRRDIIPPDADFGKNAHITTSRVLKHWTSKSRPRKQHPCMKIVFTIRSRDQGWGGSHLDHGTYRGSFTWFDAGLERIEAIDPAKCSPPNSVPDGFTNHFSLGDPRIHRDIPLISCILRTQIPLVLPIPASGTGSETKYRLDHPFLPPSTKLQANLMASREVREHVVTWSHDDCIVAESPEGDQLESVGRGRETGDGSFVRTLRVGDVVTVWARARFPGWTNQVEEVKVDVYWAV